MRVRDWVKTSRRAVVLRPAPSAGLALFMVLNFHFASDVLLHYAYLTNGYGLPVLSGLVALMIGGKNLPFSLSK